MNTAIEIFSVNNNPTPDACAARSRAVEGRYNVFDPKMVCQRR